MDIGDNGDNFRKSLVNNLQLHGFSETEALWITRGGITAANAAMTALNDALESYFRNAPADPVLAMNVQRIVVGVMRGRMDLLDQLLDKQADDEGVIQTVRTVEATGNAIMSLQP